MIFGVVSQKGGVGKTTLVQNLGAELSGLGKRVLLVDFDPLGNLSVGWGVDPDQLEKTVLQGLNHPKKAKDAVIKLRPKIDLLPANDSLVGDSVKKLKRMIGGVSADYDMVIIDSPPSFNMLTQSVIDAADHLLVPLQVHPFAYRASDRMVRLMNGKGRRKQTKPIGIVLTMVDQRNSLTKAIEHSARERFGKDVLKVKIPRNVQIAEAPLNGLPVGEYERMSKGAKAFRALAKEINKIYG